MTSQDTKLKSPHPPWLKKRLVLGDEYFNSKNTLKRLRLATVCEGALCPNQSECFSDRKATFLILGPSCTRSCSFCNVEKSCPSDVDPSTLLRVNPERPSTGLKIAPSAAEGRNRGIDLDEPQRILQYVKTSGLGYVVITSVTRDDLPDGGAFQFAETIKLIKGYRSDIIVEALVPDFMGFGASVQKILIAGVDVFGHNIETVKRLYPVVRGDAQYARSLDILSMAKDIRKGVLTKSGMMLGLGEKREEVLEAMVDLASRCCDILTIGQYLRPGPKNIEIDRFVEPDEFQMFKKSAMDLGFKHVSAGPFVRSSYRAEEAYTSTTGAVEEVYAATQPPLFDRRQT